MNQKDSTSPPIKWAGGKTRLLPELLARLPPAWGTFYEPFAGGAALFFKIAPKRAVVADVNADLIGMYRVLAIDPAAVIRDLRRHKRSHSAQHYYAVRDQWKLRASWSPSRAAGAFVYLNKTCFNGLWRVNRAGEFNVPLGAYDKPAICEPESLRRAHVLLARADLRVGDYRQTVRDAEAGDLIYFDPPYDPLSTTAAFTAFTPTRFGRDEQRQLSETAKQLVRRGCHVMLSNSDTPFIRSLYDDFKIERVKCVRSINSNTARRGDVNELIITG